MNVFKTWLLSYFYDFVEDASLVTTFKEFLSNAIVRGNDLAMAKAGAQLLKICERQVIQ